MSSSSLVLPKNPDEDSLPLLLRAKLMLEHAKEHSSQKTEFNNMISILGFDNTVEYMLRTVVSHLDLEGVTGKKFSDFDLASLAAEVNKTLQNLAGVSLPYMAEIKLLRQTRNLVQHGAVAPYADLDRFGRIVELFIDRTLERVFGLNVRELQISSAIQDETAKMFLGKAEHSIQEKEWLKAIVSSRNAFENQRFLRLRHSDISLSLYPSLVNEKEQNDLPSWGMQAIKNELELNYLGINNPEYRHFKEYLDHIPREYCSEDSWGNIVMQRPWQREDAVFCYSYVSGVILRWQAREKEKLYTPRLDKEYRFDETIAGIRLGEESERGCLYAYENNQSLYLFYTDLKKKRKFEKLKQHKIYKFRTASYINGKKESVNEDKIELLGKYTFLVTHQPERWAVIIWYRGVI